MEFFHWWKCLKISENLSLKWVFYFLWGFEFGATPKIAQELRDHFWCCSKKVILEIDLGVVPYKEIIWYLNYIPSLLKWDFPRKIQMLLSYELRKIMYYRHNYFESHLLGILEVFPCKTKKIKVFPSISTSVNHFINTKCS